MRKKVLILGSKGMFANAMISEALIHQDDIHVCVGGRKPNPFFNNLSYFHFDALTSSLDFHRFDYIINCIGLIKPYIDDKNDGDVMQAIEINTLFPRRLSYQNPNTIIIHITTDCVFSGRVRENLYYEDSSHDPTDVYGKTKSLGEIRDNKNFFNFRTSIIGVDHFHKRSLLSWFLNNKNSSLDGYTNHFWNGITIMALAKICIGFIINKHPDAPNIIHIIPNNSVTKYHLLCLFQERFATNFTIEKKETKESIYRVLGTNFPSIVEYMWRKAGYSYIPSIETLVRNL